jgi:hypothetical protein
MDARGRQAIAVKTLSHDADKAELLRRLKHVSPSSARRWGRMSAHQMVCHLIDSFRMALGEKAVSDDTTLLRRTILKWIVLYVPLRWPAGVVTTPELDQEIGGCTPTDFNADVAELEILIERTTRHQGFVRTHPIFGAMSEKNWLRWAYLHTDHHLRQFGA